VKSPKSPEVEGSERATVVRKVDLAGLKAKVREAAKEKVTIKQVSLISLKEGAYLAIVTGPNYAPMDASSIAEDGLREGAVKAKIMSLLGGNCRFGSGVWERAKMIVDVGAKITFELGAQDKKGMFLIRVKEG